jgi:nitrite reductase/ring-hydroxylating ferredoxin subunit
MMEFVKVAQVDRLHIRRGTLVAVNGEDIVLFKRGAEVFAISNVCAHQHFSRLHDGSVTDFVVTCPMHGWSYDFRTGSATSGQGRVRSFPVKILGNDVFVTVGEPGHE